ncbi:uncharacterized protein LOC133302545 [Gastrolobium bilobum]|uniref:uncharacterized protein LOC133302545 n=1 Tax=Gastrolobium bilobum TaxID=150636 RepID=UPI002AB103A5|nr:uncharacterized protein LOC133302545 [Gastrolobium bilobum]
MAIANQVHLPEYLTNPTHPYYLHPNESPSQILVTPPLNGRNFHPWSRAMTMALRSKNKLGFINENQHVPNDEDPEYEAWDRCNTIVLGWIHRSITQNIAQSILWIEKASSAWKDLHDRFSQTDMFRISYLQEDIYKLFQGDKSVSDYFTQLKTMWDELNNLKPLPNPTVPCVCGTVEQMRLYRDRDQTIRFLKGLNEQFAQVRSQIMLVEPLPNVTKAFSLISQQERQFLSENNMNFSNNSQVMATFGEQQNNRRASGYFNGGRSYRGRGRSNFGRGSHISKFCTHCNRPHHTVESCYLLHGFPPGYKRSNPVHNSAAVAHTDMGNHESSIQSQSSITMTQDQYNHILDLLQNSNTMQSSQNQHSINAANSSHPMADNAQTGNMSVEWVIDTGATDHITHTLSQFSTFHKIKPISIHLPNGSTVASSICGTVNITSSLILTDVLYVPSFHINLLSVTKLLSSLPYTITFNESVCVIHERRSSCLMTIGSARRRNGLYVMISNANKTVAHTNTSPCNKTSQNDVCYLAPKIRSYL